MLWQDLFPALTFLYVACMSYIKPPAHPNWIFQKCSCQRSSCQQFALSIQCSMTLLQDLLLVCIYMYEPHETSFLTYKRGMQQLAYGNSQIHTQNDCHTPHAYQLRVNYPMFVLPCTCTKHEADVHLYTHLMIRHLFAETNRYVYIHQHMCSGGAFTVKYMK